MTIVLNDCVALGCSVGLSAPEGAPVQVNRFTAVDSGEGIRIRSREEDRLARLSTFIAELSALERAELTQVLGEKPDQDASRRFSASAPGAAILQKLRVGAHDVAAIATIADCLRGILSGG